MKHPLFPIIVFALLLSFGSVGLAKAATTITSSAIDHIVIFPNDKPTLVDIGTDQQFLAAGYTAENKPVQNITFHWSTAGDVGVITNTGIFTGKRGGIGQIIATSGAVHASIGIVVKGYAQKPEPKPTVLGATTAIPGTHYYAQSGTQPTNTSSNTNSENVNTNTSATPAVSAEKAACSSWPAIAWIGILFAYAVVLIFYFLLIGDTSSPWWWLPPAILTVMLFVLYMGVRCGTGRVWIPIVLVVIGAGISFLYYQLLRPRGNTIYLPPQQ